MPQLELHEILKHVDLGKAKLDALRPLPSSTAASLRESLALDWTYNSNAIEGNTLTLSETKVVLEGITVGGKSLREHLEAVNHRDAIEYVENLVKSREALTEQDILTLHGLVLKGIDSNEAGRYRRQNVIIGGAKIRPPNFTHVRDEIAALLDWRKAAQAMHPIEREAQFHARFEKIHPFIDGNGRTGRLLLNLELLKEGYPVAVIRREDRMQYYEALGKADAQDDYTSLTRMVAEAVARTQDLYLEVLTGK